MPSKTFYITTPIYYVNDAPHIGHAYTTVLADVLARWHRLLGHETFFLTGTDEHGQKVQQAAEKRGVTPQAHCDFFSERFQDAWKGLGIGYDHFLRTTDASHIAFVRAQAQNLWDKGEVYAKEYEGWYSTSEERFFTEKELVDGKDPISGRPVEWIKEKNYFFKMSAYQGWLLKHIEDHPDFILPDFRRNEVLGFLRQPLADLCISRPKSRLSWGISLPFDEDYVAYVWVDALLNYTSAVLGTSTSGVEGRRFSDGSSLWPADVHLIGKDILTTHAVYWPTLLQALGLPQPRHILAHGWWMVDNARMSKTTGNVVSPLAMKDKYGVDAFRYFLIREMNVGQDASFSEEGFVGRLNADLANDVGNGLSRVLKLAQALGSKLTSAKAENEDDGGLRKAAESALASAPEKALQFKLSFAVDDALHVFRAVNRYLEITAPWKLAKGGEEAARRLNTVLWHAAESLRIGFTLLAPVMPSKSAAALEALGFGPAHSALAWRDAARMDLLTSVPALFPRVVAETAAPTTEPEDPFSAVDLRAVKILTAEDHPQAEALYVLTVDAGGETRTVCAGLRKHVAKDSLAGKTAALVANLKPVSLRGIVSQGMLLAASGAEGALSLVVPEQAQPGDRIAAEGVESNPKPQIGIKDFEKCPLRVLGNRVHYREHALATARGPVVSAAPDGSEVR